MVFVCAGAIIFISWGNHSAPEFGVSDILRSPPERDLVVRLVQDVLGVSV